MRQLAEVRRRLVAAEDVLAAALAEMKRADEAFDAASDRFAVAESALDAAREERAVARWERYAARQAHGSAATAMARLQRRVSELSGWADRMAELRARLLSWIGQMF